MENDEIKPGEQLTLAQINRLVKQAQGQQSPTPGSGLREDGPTVAEFIASGYKASNYPPAGYASRSTAEEIEAALEAEKGAPETDPLKMKVPELKEWLTEKGISFDATAKKEDLQALVPAE